MAGPRIDAVDRIKALAIIAVAVTHAGPPRWSPQWTPTDEWLRIVWTAFHVPAFLLVAGMLYRTDGPMRWATVGRRIVRVVVPYLVVMTALYLTGLAPLPAWRGLPFAVLTGESYGIYYFVVVLVVCILFGWVLSRLEPRTVVMVTVALIAYWVLVAAFGPAPGIAPGFWRIRDPLGGFYFGYFAWGWLSLAPLLAARVSRGWLALGACTIVVLWSVLGVPPPMPLRAVPLRQLYTLAVTGMLWQATFTFPGMRFLSEASLGLYLLHRPVMDLLTPVMQGYAPIERITALTVGGLGGATLLCLAARRILGPVRARFWIGA